MRDAIGRQQRPSQTDCSDGGRGDYQTHERPERQNLGAEEEQQNAAREQRGDCDGRLCERVDEEVAAGCPAEDGFERSFCGGVGEEQRLASVGIIARLQRPNPILNQRGTMASPDNGIVGIPSNHSVDETLKRLQELLQAKGVTLFALVDHSGEAEKVGMHMRPTKLLIFGNPRAGTPVMLEAPSSAIDLPLKILIWEDGDGRVWLSYNDPAYLKQRHSIPEELMKNISVMQALAASAGQ